MLFKQIGKYLDIFFQNFNAVLEGYSTQHCLLALIEKWKSAVGKGKSFGKLLTNLSKVFDCLPHDLLIAKLHSHCFSLVVSI